MTQEELSFAAGIDRSYLSELERDKKSPTVAMLLRLRNAMNCSAAEVVARVEKKRDKPD